MKLIAAILLTSSICAATLSAQERPAPSANPKPAAAANPTWDSRAAARYLDGRMNWWLGWPNAARDHQTSCVSCHTALPYALARPAIRWSMFPSAVEEPERRLHENVVKRVTMWKEVDPFYPDQTRGLPKTSESRGTEAVLNALIIATRDSMSAPRGEDVLTTKGLALSEAGKLAFDNMWALQFRSGELKGAWAWLNFHYEPWESNGSPYFGAALAALAVSRAPGKYAASAEIQTQVKLLREYLQRGADTVSLFNRAMGLWASSQLPGALTPPQRESIVAALTAKQQPDGGWSTASLGTWKRVDSTALDARSDGHATGLVVHALQCSGIASTDPRVKRGVTWLHEHQDAATGMWQASSLNKNRDPGTDIGKFMSDAATGYAVLALTHSC